MDYQNLLDDYVKKDMVQEKQISLMNDFINELNV